MATNYGRGRSSATKIHAMRFGIHERPHREAFCGLLTLNAITTEAFRAIIGVHTCQTCVKLLNKEGK